jgi:hypothetical protein
MNAMMHFEDPPDFIIIQIGGNAIGNVRIGYLHLELKQFITWVSEQLPHASIIFPRYCHAVNGGTLGI